MEETGPVKMMCPQARASSTGNSEHTTETTTWKGFWVLTCSNKKGPKLLLWHMGIYDLGAFMTSLQTLPSHKRTKIKISEH